jgi:toxin-antitoxin system PIN domain toxin
MAFLADVNVVVALLHARHAMAGRAVAWLARQEEDASILLCRVVPMGAVRILTNPGWLKSEVMPARKAWAAWDRMLSDGRFAVVEEPAGLEMEWRRLTSRFAAGRCAETDAYLAAMAVSGGYRLVTFDRGFQRFSGVEVDILT